MAGYCLLLDFTKFKTWQRIFTVIFKPTMKILTHQKHPLFSRILPLSSFLILVLSMASCSEQPQPCVSPDGSIRVSLARTEGSDGCYGYSAELNGKIICYPSPLGISLAAKGFDFTGSLTLTGVDSASIKEEYRLTSGKKQHVTDMGKEIAYRFTNPDRNEMVVRFRTFNDGIAFRYELQNPAADTLRSELSGFTINPASRSWMMKFRCDYEDYYLLRALDTLNEPEYMLPALFETPDSAWMLLGESGVYSQYPAAQIKSGKPGTFRIHLPDRKVPGSEPRPGTWEELVGKETSTVIVPKNLITPWRVLIVSRDIGKIVESTLIESLSKPNELLDTTWCRAGVSTFPWWGDSEANDKPDVMEQYVDFAAEMGWTYIEFDIGLLGNKGGYAADYWRNIPYIPEIIAYARKKGVGVVGWDERRYLDTPEKRDDIFSKYWDWGVKGIKVDFVNSEKQEAMAFRETILKHAAQYNLMVSFHGDISPRGLRRTYPNLMTQEGVKGAEYYKFGAEYGRANPVHNTTLPFTRNITGPMDYTPVSFSSGQRETTVGHELALAFLYESGWVNIADRPDVIRKSPACELLKQLRAVWDDIRFIDGYPGEFCCLARRSGSEWFISAINGPGEKNISIDFSFLKPGIYQARLYADIDDKTDLLGITDFTVGDKETRIFKVVPNGGWVIAISNKVSI